MDLATGKIFGAEALLRWECPGSGSVSPKEFIPVLEDTGMIVPVGEWVLRTACRQGKVWQERGLCPLRVAANLSARQFGQEGLVDTVVGILEETGLYSLTLELEITESLLMEDVEASTKALTKLKRSVHGIRIAMTILGPDTPHSTASRPYPSTCSRSTAPLSGTS